MSAVLPRTGADVPGWDAVAAAGLTGGGAFADRAAEHAALRSVAAGDLGLARVLDGHRNALERLLLHRPDEVAAADRACAAEGVVPHGVWGADPRPDDVPASVPAALDEDGRTVSGVKVFCSGAGLVERALVLVRPAPGAAGPTACVLLDVSDPDRAAVDRSWFAGAALRTSASHRVVLDRARVLATLGPAGRASALLEEPWFSGDALRTAVTWAGALDAVLAGTGDALRGRECSDAEAVLLGRAHAARASVDRWLDHATAAITEDPAGLPRTVLLARLEITERCREALRACAELTGSHPMAVGADAARARADLDLLLLQHRLTPAAVRLGRELLSTANGSTTS
ncbi:hypothetical protein AB0L40_23860 [Patulibacter sp. NPDC049589]|uniref:hypothetical protein n=1 Tax=Patulibacter sp. NPDC049589 TaxID=3154731 RepID=UPI00342BE131